jgi:shikimate dehydrogenase
MKVYGVFGDPIEHSLSPVMQNAAFEAMQLAACYLAFKVSKTKLQSAIKGANAMGFGGLNLTIPLKEEALNIVTPDEIAEKIGAINTVVFNGEMMGYNTDGMGASLALKKADVRIKGKQVLLIGAGGAAKAVAYQLAEEGGEIIVANRRPERALDLANQVGGSGYGLDELKRLVPKADVVINATSLGMSAGDPQLLDGKLLKSGQVVFDIVYNRKTDLLIDAELAGAKTLDGVMMLVYQGAHAIKLWTGQNAPIEVMENALRKALRR